MNISFCGRHQPYLLTTFPLTAKTLQVLPFLEVVHCSFDEYLGRIPQHLHELHRKVLHFLSCDDKDAMTVKTQKKTEKVQTA